MRRPRQRPGAGSGRRAAALGAVAAAGAGVAVGLLRWRLWGADVPDVEPAALAEWFDPAEIERHRRYRAGVWTMAALAVPIAPATAVAAAALGGRWRPRLVRAARARPARAGLLFGAGLAAATTLVAVPLSAARFAWGRSYGVVTQDAAGWLADLAKGIGLQALVAAALGAGAAALIARAPRLWWVGLAAGAAGLVFAFSLLSPLLVEPLFQRTEPLRDRALAGEVLDLADRAGVRADRVEVNDAGSRTTAANAYVSGFGGSRHIVLYDTLVEGFPREQVRFVAAHELAHVERRHVLKGSAWAAALAVPACLAAFAAVGWRTGFRPPGRGPEGCDLVVRRVAVAAAAGAVLLAASAPLASWVSRAYEREAEWRAHSLAEDPRAAIGLQRGLVERGLGVPDPPAAVRVWFGTHPTPLERIGMALARERGGGGR